MPPRNAAQAGHLKWLKPAKADCQLYFSEVSQEDWPTGELRTFIKRNETDLGSES